MKIKNFWTISLMILLTISTAFAESKSSAEFARQAISNDAAKSGEAIASLREQGKAGLETLLKTYSSEIKEFSQTGEATEKWKKIAFAIDSVAMQKDAYASKLYWFTDLEAAKRKAENSNKPILSLRLLGNLNEEFSCANSRFFRALLYSNAEISKYLNENYVLHWKSVRPAPKVTIDFGDGRKIERTLTGNSIHYILDKHGEIVDALPGLYSPSEFLKYVKKGNEINLAIGNMVINADNTISPEKEMVLLRYRAANFNEIRQKRDQSIAKAQVQLIEPKNDTTALEVATRAATKMVTETTILRSLYDNFYRFEPQIIPEDWKKLAKIYTGEVEFDASSQAFIKRQNKNLNAAELITLINNLKTYVALDTTRNESLFHTNLYQRLNEARNKNLDLEKFNSKVYAEIFKTPDSDKWLGLYTTDVYTALDGNGIR